MHVARNKRAYVTKSGEEKTYESVLLRRTYRQGGKVKHETLANLKAPARRCGRRGRGDAEGQPALIRDLQRDFNAAVAPDGESQPVDRLHRGDLALQQTPAHQTPKSPAHEHANQQRRSPGRAAPTGGCENQPSRGPSTHRSGLTARAAAVDIVAISSINSLRDSSMAPSSQSLTAWAMPTTMTSDAVPSRARSWAVASVSASSALTSSPARVRSARPMVFLSGPLPITSTYSRALRGSSVRISTTAVNAARSRCDSRCRDRRRLA